MLLRRLFCNAVGGAKISGNTRWHSECRVTGSSGIGAAKTDVWCYSMQSGEHLLEPSFLADAMLGRLARWLRALGYDTLYNPAPEDRDLVAIANAEDRILLTRDRHLMTFLQPARGLLLKSDKPLCQLREVVEVSGLAAPKALITRCMMCNRSVREATVGEVSAAPRSIVGARTGNINLCPGCGRLYWYGSHTRRMRERLEQALPGWLAY
jgi:uncharacterized protein with PIN domain